ncbi:MAG: Firmicu-CTERM sorting domain-containing protein [Saccharofermentans sp.]|nr:Firmicu-CTERM sorting domain-containing protein [Saccharofermentans sp.]
MRNLRKVVTVLSSAVLVVFIGMRSVPVMADTNPADVSANIQIDGVYGDWSGVPETNITYSAWNGTGVHIAQLYTDGEYLYGHIKMCDLMNTPFPFDAFRLKINGIDQEFHVCLDNNYFSNAAPTTLGSYGSNLSIGVRGDRTHWQPAMLSSTVSYTVYDQPYVHNNDTRAPEIEFKISLADLAEAYGISPEEIGTITLSNHTLGGSGVSVAGTPTGAIIGIGIAVLLAVIGITKFYKGKDETVKE